MAYQTGTTTNSHELGSIIYGFLRSMGWECISTLNTDPVEPVGSDWVFRAYGRDGDRFMNIRIASGLSDTASRGEIQHPMQDGYTGYLNGLAYHYFNAGGTNPSVDGHSELGRLGPLLYCNHNESTNYYEFNMWKSSPASKVYRALVDGGYAAGRNWSNFDGKRFVFQRTATSPKTHRLDLYDNSITNISDSINDGSPSSAYVRLENGKEYIYLNSYTYTENKRIQRYDIENNVWENVPDNLTTGTERMYGAVIPGVKRTNRDVQWIYVFRGWDTKVWGMHNVENGQWTDPCTELPPYNIGPPGGYTYSDIRPVGIFLTKEQSGYSSDRLYITRGPTGREWFSVGLNDDGYAIAGSWLQHADLPYAQTRGSGFFTLEDGLYWRPGGSYSDIRNNLYKWEFGSNPSDTTAWTLVHENWYLGDSDDEQPVLEVQNHLCTKVRVSEFRTNTYWLFGNHDRLVVVVKDANGDYSYMYLGLFNPYANGATTYLRNDAGVGSSTVKVVDPDLFEIGKKYLISSVHGESVTKTSNWDGSTRKFGASQIITVVGKSDYTLITTTLDYDFYAGAKIGEDPATLMVSVYGRDHAQTLDNLSLIYNSNFEDPPWQTYRLVPAVSSTFADATDHDERASTTYLYPILLVQDGSSSIGREVRGELIGVYSCGTAVASEEEISSGSDTYKAFAITNSGISQRIVIGPM